MNKKGFSLIELVVVIAVIGIIGAGVYVRNFTDQSRTSPTPTPQPTVTPVQENSYTHPNFPDITLNYDDTWTLNVLEEESPLLGDSVVNITLSLSKKDHVLTYHASPSTAFGWTGGCSKKGEYFYTRINDNLVRANGDTANQYLYHTSVYDRDVRYETMQSIADAHGLNIDDYIACGGGGIATSTTFPHPDEEGRNLSAPLNINLTVPDKADQSIVAEADQIVADSLPETKESSLDGQDILLNETVPSNSYSGTDPTFNPDDLFNLRVIIATDSVMESVYIADEEMTPNSVQLVYQRPDESKTSGGGFINQVYQSGEYLVIGYSSVDYNDLIIFKTSGALVTSSFLSENEDLLSNLGYNFTVARYEGSFARDEMKVFLTGVTDQNVEAVVSLRSGKILSKSLVEL